MSKKLLRTLLREQNTPDKTPIALVVPPPPERSVAEQWVLDRQREEDAFLIRFLNALAEQKGKA